MEIPFKCLLIGDAGVGKTSFSRAYAWNAKLQEYKSTIGGKT